jgi:glycerol-3-phosphate dehydrogenase
MRREEQIQRAEDNSIVWDMAVIGGGATGLGAALDAALRGLKVVLIEQSDFTKGTSSRSTKLVHGGVRYLGQGDVSLVLEALHERGLLLKNAPHLVKNQSFIIPNYRWWEGPFYTIGLTLYDLLAGRLSLGRSLHIGKKKAMAKLPLLKTSSLYGGVIYHDGQFDDSRLAINVAQSCVESGGCVLNYVQATGLVKDKNGRIAGVEVKDLETNRSFRINAKTVINATGVFVDSIMQMDTPEAKDMVRPSQGVHLVLDKSFLQSDYALMIPKTDDGRVLFAVPWHSKVVVGTTDTLMEKPVLEPQALEKEIEFILNTAGRYLTKKPTRKDVLSIFAGLRPLAAPKGEGKSTKEISRSHKIMVSDSGLITITGGKWTTFRKMAEDTVDEAIKLAGLEAKSCSTKNFHIHGYRPNPNLNDHLYVYGADMDAIIKLAKSSEEYNEKLHPNHEYRAAEVVWAARYEMARTVEDVLARRVRLLFLDAKLSIEVAPKVAAILAKELGKDDQWVEQQVKDYAKLAANFVLSA